MDEFRIWNKARSQSEIQATMNNTLTGSESGLVAYYKMNDGSGTSLADSSSNSNTATLYNMTDSDWIQGNASFSDSPSSMTFTLDPSDNLTSGTTYLTRVTTGVKDASGNAMSSQYETSNGFTTASSPVSDRWSSSLKGGKIVLSNDNLDATSWSIFHSWNSVYGEKSYASADGGIYEWKIQVISVDDDGGNTWEMVIGVGGFTSDVDSSYNKTDYLSSSTKGYGYIQQSGKKTSGGSSQSFLSAYGLNDNITVRLDLNNHRLSFGKNNGDITVSHSSLPSGSGQKYRLAASIGDDGDKFRIISHTTVGLVDIDGNEYSTVVIGTQHWMAENLKVTKYRNGDNITNITNNSLWNSNTSGAYGYYNNSTANRDIYGLLYNGYAVDDIGNQICPQGWHVPSSIEFDTLKSYLVQSGDSNFVLKLREEGTDHWSTDINASNSSGFTALGSGYLSTAGASNN